MHYEFGREVIALDSGLDDLFFCARFFFLNYNIHDIFAVLIVH